MIRLFGSHPSQTEFNAEEPFSEEQTPIYRDEPELTASPTSKKKLYILAGIGGAVFVMFLILIIVISRTDKSAEQEPVVVKDVTVPVQSSDKVSRAIEQLKTDLTLADPSVQLFTFPPVLTKVGIDTKE